MVLHAGRLVGGNLVYRIASALLTIVIAKLVTAQQYGAFSYALAVVSFAGYFCELGLQNTYLREVSGRTAGWRECTVTALYIRCLLLVVVITTGLLWLRFAVAGSVSRECIELMLVPAVAGTMLTVWTTGAMLSRSDTKAVFGTRTRAALAQVACVSAGLLVPVSAAQRPGAVALSYGCGLLCGGFFGIRSLQLRSLRVSVRRARYFTVRLTAGLHAYLLSGFLYILAPNLGVLVLGKTSSLAVVGTFALASRVPQFLYTIPGAVGQAFYPALFEAYRDQHLTTWADLLFREAIFLLATGLVLSTTVVITAPLVVRIIGHAHDPAYQSGLRAAVLVGALVILMQSLSTPLGHALETAGLPHLRTVGQIVSQGTGVMLFALLGSRFGAPGAMVAAATSETIVYLSWLLLLIRYVKPARVTRLLGPSFGVLGCVSLAGAGVWLLGCTQI
ncbi:lipopolysaccharide biosynthesis protein [Paraburkholderia sp. BCC1885]|uniref:lipopolysaccharide biosynthesis protein n=1 Tax=Paraburkholderia sp. BCC1885 TaxID=2562669 RepID=UPI0011831F03|nr:lipopolysaccharide biosynthesis protein [Paraburkholderia sp. BCC1885]